jgi:hypothetical protein
VKVSVALGEENPQNFPPKSHLIVYRFSNSDLYTARQKRIGLSEVKLITATVNKSAT